MKHHPPTPSRGALQGAIEKGQHAAKHDAKKGAAGAREVEKLTQSSIDRLKALLGLK